MTPLVLIENNEQAETCRSCGGKCCQHMPGIYHPEDAGADMMAWLLAGFERGELAVDWWEGDPREEVPEEERLGRAYYVRPRRINVITQLRDPAWMGGQCQHLEEKGCKLRFEKRPAECRALVPNQEKPGECVSPAGFTKQALAVAWIPFNDIVEEAMKRIEESRIGRYGFARRSSYPKRC